MKGAGASGNHSQLLQRRNEEFTETSPGGNSRLQTSRFATPLGLMNQKNLYIVSGESIAALGFPASSLLQCSRSTF